MSTNTLEGNGQNLTGNVKQALGSATGDKQMENSGLADQVIGTAKQAAGSVSDAVANPGPLLDKAKTFARERPWATAALVGVLGLATINTLRGK